MNIKETFEILETTSFSFSKIFIICLLIIGFIFIGKSLFIRKKVKLSERLIPVYFGSFLIILAAFIGAYKGYIQW